MKHVETSGLDVDYRCVRCRNCADCRTAEQTDKVSLRQEVESQQHMDSVELDIANRRVQISLEILCSGNCALAQTSERASPYT